MTGTRRVRIVLLLFLAVALYLVPVFPHGGSATEIAHWSIVASIVETGSPEVSRLKPLIGDLMDSAHVGGRVYPNKPPGVALLGAIGYLAVRPFTGPPSPHNLRVTWTAMRWFAVTLPVLLMGLVFARRGETSPLLLTTLLFATPFFVYATLLFSHALAGVALYLAYVLAFRSDSRRSAFFGGAAAGLAALCEFPAALAVAILGLAILLEPRRAVADRLRRAVLFIAGGAPFGLLLLLWNKTLFGSALSTGHSFSAVPKIASMNERGIAGVGFPTWAGFETLVFSPRRGLLLYAPILIVALVGLLRVKGDDAFRKIIRAALVLGMIVFYSGYGSPEGGWCAGPRYIVLVIPLLVEALEEVPELLERPFLAGAALVFSSVLCVVPAMTFSFAPTEFSFPHATFWGSLLFREGWAVPTLAGLLGFSRPFVLLPVAAAVLAALVLALAGLGRRAFAGALAGIAIAAGYIALPGLDKIEYAVERAYVMENYFKPADRLSQFLPKSSPLDQARLMGGIQHVKDVRRLGPDDWPY